MSASRVAKMMGFDSLIHAGSLIGLKANTLSIKYKDNRSGFEKDMLEAKLLLDGRESSEEFDKNSKRIGR